MYNRTLFLCLSLACATSFAQGRLLLDEAAARKNLISAPEPTEPAGLHLSGKVVVLVEIAPDGHVTAATADSGNSKLREPAVDAVKKWRFKPFQSHGARTTASTKLTLEFPPASASPHSASTPPAAEPTAVPNDPTAQQFAALEDQCRTLVAARAEPAQEAAACRAAADLAGHLQGDTRSLAQRSSAVYAATALMRTDDLKAAVAYGTRAIAAAAQGHDDSGSSAAYAVRGQANAFAGNLPAADRDLARAEDFERKALAAAAGSQQEPESRAAMKSLLLFHAQLLTALKQPEKAADKSAEAAKL